MTPRCHRYTNVLAWVGVTVVSLASAVAQPVIFTNFSSTSGLTLNGSATTASSAAGDGTVLRLVAAPTIAVPSPSSPGSAFTTTQRSISTGFSTTFSFRFTSPSGTTDSASGASPGADGIVFAVQRIAPTALGDTGEGLGFLNIGANSAGVEFDIWQNTNRGDPNSSHVGVDKNGSVTSVSPTANVSPNLDNGGKWTAWLDYNAATSTLEIRVSQNGVRPTSPTLTQTLNFATVIGGSSAFIGFTGATGGAYANHDIISWVFNEGYQSNGITMGTWSGSGSWSNASLWGSGAVPGASDVAILTSGTPTIDDTRSLGGLLFSGGTIGGAGTLTLLGYGSAWTGGTFNGTGTLAIAAGGTLDISGAVNHDFATGAGTGGRTLQNAGTVRWTAGNVRGGDGASFVNASTGLFEISGNGTFGAAGTGATPVFSNAGTVRNTTGTNVFAIPFTNTNGTVQVTGGRLEFNSTFTQNSGAINLTNNSTIKFGLGLNLAAGTLGGTGTVIGTVSSAGTISPGNSPGVLSITGDLNLQSTSNLIFELGGTGQGTAYDFMSVSGAASLGGYLQFKVINGFLPSAGQTFTILTAAGGITNSFVNVANGGQLAGMDGFGIFTVNYGGGSNSIMLSNFVAVPEPSTWALLGVGAVLLIGTGVRRRQRG